MTFIGRVFAKTKNRVTLAAGVFWVLYVMAVRPWVNHSPVRFYDVGAFFARIGANVARAVGLNPWDTGAVQFLSGLAALLLSVQLAFWVFETIRKKEQPNG
jgi:hypothetical protein